LLVDEEFTFSIRARLASRMGFSCMIVVLAILETLCWRSCFDICLEIRAGLDKKNYIY
jgi:hypothetical protein